MGKKIIKQRLGKTTAADSEPAEKKGEGHSRQGFPHSHGSGPGLSRGEEGSGRPDILFFLKP